MTVSNLINELSSVPPDKLVKIFVSEYGYLELENVTEITEAQTYIVLESSAE